MSSDPVSIQIELIVPQQNVREGEMEYLGLAAEYMGLQTTKVTALALKSMLLSF